MIRGYQSLEDQMRETTTTTRILTKTRIEVVYRSERIIEARRETDSFWDRHFTGFSSPDTVRNQPKATNPTIVAEEIDSGV